MPANREKVRFRSGGMECAAWHYPGTNGGCVVMAGGFGVTKEPATDLFAGRFHDAGFTVLAFDYRHLGESDGQPRQVVRVREQLADSRAAIRFAATLPGVDPTRVALWGFSSSGVTSSASRPAIRSSRRPSPRHRTPTASLSPATRPTTRSRSPARPHRPGNPRRPREPHRPPTTAGTARRPAGNRRGTHHPGHPRRRSSPQPGRPVPGLAAGSRRPISAGTRPLPPRPARTPNLGSAARPDLRAGPIGTARTRDPRGQAGTTRRTGPAARRPLRPLPRRPRPGRRSRTVVPA